MRGSIGDRCVREHRIGVDVVAATIDSGAAPVHDVHGPIFQPTVLRETTMMNVVSSLVESARMDAEKPALRLDGDVLSYAALDEASARLAGLLRDRGAAPGDRVGIMVLGGSL
jgi:hypothetical protein